MSSDRLRCVPLLLLFTLVGVTGCAHNSCGEADSCPTVSSRVKKCFLFHHDKCSPKPYWSMEGYQTDLDKFFVKHAAKKCAKESLKTMSADCQDKPSKSFRKGYQQAYMDIALGESGVVPPVPPEEYWAAHYRTPEGYMEVQEWFTGYKLGSEHARADGRYDYNRIATPYSLAGWEQPVAEHWDGNVAYPEESMPSQVPVETHPAPAPAVPPRHHGSETTLPPPPVSGPQTPLKTVPQRHLPEPPPVQSLPDRTPSAQPRPLVPQPRIQPPAVKPTPRPSAGIQHTPLPDQKAKPIRPQIKEPALPAYINDDPPPSPYSLQSYPYTPLPGTGARLDTQGAINQMNGQRYSDSSIEDYPYR